MKKLREFSKDYAAPVGVVTGIIIHVVLLHVFRLELASTIVICLTIGFGSIDLIRDTVASVKKRKFALDYIALLAITTGTVTGEFLVASVIVLMLTGGQTLEKYAVARAKHSLTALADRIPKRVLLWVGDNFDKSVDIESVTAGQKIFVRKGEVIPLDGTLDSESGLTDESSLTGEPYEIDKFTGDAVRSGTVNIGNPMVITVTKPDRESTYRKILDMVRVAQDERSPLIRIADRYSGIFTVITLCIAAFAYWMSGNFHQVLAVLVIATPCPLILATPIALMGGMNALARRKIIGKTLTSIESLSRVTDIMFDKTGTLTIGRPQVVRLDIKKRQYSKALVLGIAHSIERNSLHPLAKAIVAYAKDHNARPVKASCVSEKIGYGISAEVSGKSYTLSKVRGTAGFAIELRSKASRIAVFYFEDKLKSDAFAVMRTLNMQNISLAVYTGDKKEATDLALQHFGPLDISVKTECSPADKLRGIKDLRNKGKVTAMVGDGINDAPALAAADVGMVFSNEEQTAASQAADLVFLGGDFSMVLDSLRIAKKTMSIARESIFIGIGLSTLGMIGASLGYIPPLYGALLQEAIDVGVIINALRTSA